jgi:uroporphyrin-3 C-methyltransferase
MPCRWPTSGEAAGRAGADSFGRPPAGFWEKLLGELWRELKSLVRIERHRPARSGAALAQPAFFLRENLKLRLVNARLALLQRDGKSSAGHSPGAEWLERYFDPRQAGAGGAGDAEASWPPTDVGASILPGLAGSLTTLRNLKIAREGARRQARDR